HGAHVRALTAVNAPMAALGAPGAPIVLAGIQQAEAEQARKRLDALPGVDGQVVIGPAGHALRELSRNVDLLVLASRDRGKVRRALLGSTVDAVIHRASCPVLVLPPVRARAHRDVPDDAAAALA
ncbi:MAG TPA: universal stress protein, partial [Baekduia sp.]|nr:universal stress protein [Baekduia sp.]